MDFLDKIFGRLFGKKSEESAFFECTFLLLGKLTSADGRVSDDEVLVVERFMESHLNLSPDQRDKARALFVKGQKGSGLTQQYIRALWESVSRRELLVDTLLDVLLQVAVADGEYSPEEMELIEAIALAMGVDKSHLKRLSSVYIDDEGNIGREGGFAGRSNYDLLGCAVDASDEELLRSYQKLAEYYDPERAVVDGFPMEFLNLVRQRHEEIEQAYAILSADRSASIHSVEL